MKALPFRGRFVYCDMKQLLLPVLLLFTLQTAYSQKHTKTADYFPPYNSWQHQAPQALGLKDSSLHNAINFAINHEVNASRDGETAQFQSFGKEPYSAAVGPVTERGAPAGLIIYKGYIVAEWGDPARVDIVNSISKSFLSSIIGIAVDRGMIKSTSDTVALYIPPIEVYKPDASGSNDMIYPFASDHNKRLTWEVMLRQTSDWEGTLWDKPDWADRPEGDITKYKLRKRNEPGAVWKYNDVRVNALALAATSVWRKPLPVVLKETIMDPIGASTTWRWFGYRNSWIVLDGQIIQSVSGGGHWGGGIFMNAYDMARFGLLTMHHGNWNGKQLISVQWVKQALTPTTANTGYGYMNWFLNTDKKLLPSASEKAWVHIGNGTNMIYVDPENELVVVARWIDSKAMDGFIKNVLAAVGKN
ncbi:MAG: class beta-lactamase-related serine hydrolase [Mucilaginibacter sp.]|nr:class beta-lactamase-related serine hydrolase [Mucilaginibacter sp.]